MTYYTAIRTSLVARFAISITELAAMYMHGTSEEMYEGEHACEVHAYKCTRDTCEKKLLSERNRKQI